MNEGLIVIEETVKHGVELMAPMEELLPTLFILKKDKHVEIIPIGMTASKLETDLSGALRFHLDNEKPLAYALVNEGWATQSSMNHVESFGGRVANLPPEDRVEIVSIVLVENRGESKLLIATITNESHGFNRKLSEWSESELVDGRLFIGSW